MPENTTPATPFPAASLLGYPRIGRRRELKKAVEAYWAGKIDAAALDAAAKDIQLTIAKRLQELGLTEAAAVPGTFSYYDQVLDATAHLGAVPARFGNLLNAEGQLDIDGYFTLARGNKDQQPLEMTKWFDTNYHYLVPEIGPETDFTPRLQPHRGGIRVRPRQRHRDPPVHRGPGNLPAALQGIRRRPGRLRPAVPPRGHPAGLHAAA